MPAPPIIPPIFSSPPPHIQSEDGSSTQSRPPSATSQPIQHPFARTSVSQAPNTGHAQTTQPNANVLAAAPSELDPRSVPQVSPELNPNMNLGNLAEAYRRHSSQATGSAQQRTPMPDEDGNIQFQDSNGQNVIINIGAQRPELPAWATLPAFENILNPNHRRAGNNRGTRVNRTNFTSTLDATQRHEFSQFAQVHMDLNEAQQNQTSVNEVPYEPRPQPLPANRMPRIEEANQPAALASIEMHAQIERHRIMQRTRAEPNREAQ